jgi:hypothetical protein
MARYVDIWIAALCLPACSVEPPQHLDEQPVMQLQGTALQGIVLQTPQLQGMIVTAFRFAGATLNGAPLVNIRIEKGELVAEQNHVTLRNTALANAHFLADAKSPTDHSPQTTTVEYRIAMNGIVAENPIYDPTHTGNTFLYTLEENVNNTDTWQPACPADSDGRRAAIPLSDTWDERGSRRSPAPVFTFGCTTGAIAKCYRWGYRPWITGYGNVAITHWTCTRLARADYCGDGTSQTHDGTQINVWDNLDGMGPIQMRGVTPDGMTFEAAWDQGGAICMSHARWAFNGSDIAAACPNRLHPPGQGNQSVCDSVAEALMRGGGPGRMFDDSRIMH